MVRKQVHLRSCLVSRPCYCVFCFVFLLSFISALAIPVINKRCKTNKRNMTLILFDSEKWTKVKNGKMGKWDTWCPVQPWHLFLLFSPASRLLSRLAFPFSIFAFRFLLFFLSFFVRVSVVVFVVHSELLVYFLLLFLSVLSLVLACLPKPLSTRTEHIILWGLYISV